jgi:hypothetical protein
MSIIGANHEAIHALLTISAAILTSLVVLQVKCVQDELWHVGCITIPDRS